MDDAVLNGLYGLRTAPIGWAELLAATALGGLLAILIAAALIQLRRPKGTAAQDRIVEARQLPTQARAMVLIGLLREMTDQQAPGDAPWPDRARDHFGLDNDLATRLSSLYQPGTCPDPERLEQALLAAER